jgi:hypothetical protein
MVVDEVVLGIFGFAHHVAVLKGNPSSVAETTCHGGACNAEGLEINCTPVERVVLMTVLLLDFLPRPLTNV